jgi:hypothetical protein
MNRSTGSLVLAGQSHVGAKNAEDPHPSPPPEYRRGEKGKSGCMRLPCWCLQGNRLLDPCGRSLIPRIVGTPGAGFFGNVEIVNEGTKHRNEAKFRQATLAQCESRTPHGRGWAQSPRQTLNHDFFTPQLSRHRYPTPAVSRRWNTNAQSHSRNDMSHCGNT